MSAVRNASGMVIRRFALQGARISMHWLEQIERYTAPIIQGALEPLGTSRHQGVLVYHHEMPCKTADTLATHGIALVRHSRRPDLRRLERFLDFLRDWEVIREYRLLRRQRKVIHLQVSQETNVCGDFVCGGSKRSKRSKNIDVDLSGVRLRGDGVGEREAGQLSNELVKQLDLNAD